MVGDDRQSIYGFRGADPAALHNFKATYDHPDIMRSLQTNYRSWAHTATWPVELLQRCLQVPQR